MLPRNSTLVFAVVLAVGFWRADVARAQTDVLGLTSLEWLVADSDLVVRGIVVEVSADENWNIVTLEVRETLKGAKAERLKFAAHRFADAADATLAEAKKSKREAVWLLKRQNMDVPSEAPDREKVLARNKIDLHAPFLPGRPGTPALAAIPIGGAKSEEGLQPPALLTIDLRVLDGSEMLVKAIRSAIAATRGNELAEPYTIAISKEIAQRTGFGRTLNLLTVPVDCRLEAVARRLVQSPGEFLAKDDPQQRRALRLEGIRALRRFPSEKNQAILRAWLDDPVSDQPFKGEGKSLVPPAAKVQKTEKTTLPVDLAHVPEIHFQQPLTKAMNTMDAQLHTAVNIDGVRLLNQKKIDGFMVAMLSKRPDLAGLSFAMGDACRMKPEASKKFVVALDVFRKVEFQNAMPPFPTAPGSPSAGKNEQPKAKSLMQRYQEQSAQQKIDPSASVASLMQVLGHEDGNARLGLVNYLTGLPIADATRALAKLAIFSAEAEVRTAALGALKKRDAKDYTEILLAGLKYPWPAVAERASDAIAKLGRKEMLPHLIDVLDNPDPRTPQSREIDGKKVPVVRELVRLNHHHNCLLCHAPATTTRDKSAPEELAKLEGLTAQVPVPSESMVAYYRPSMPDLLVRFDVTYLRQDFSMKLRVADADPWPELQRYDFLVRTREVSEQEATAYRELLQSIGSDSLSPYHRAAVTALRELTGLDAEPTAAAWRKLTGLDGNGSGDF